MTINKTCIFKLTKEIYGTKLSCIVSKYCHMHICKNSDYQTYLIKEQNKMAVITFYYIKTFKQESQ